ncbi:hypothetical protein MKZ02_22665 [Pseudobacillus sp. FSL P4-0506]|uniref:hypothetical protein n=1 Tax=unclassified Pseudobacillus TaxID=2619284 RepID=UPI0030F9754D
MQNQEFSQSQESSQSRASSNRRRSNSKPAKPSGFTEFEVLAKEILSGQNISYYEWLHKKHQEVVLNFNLSNKDEIAQLAKE